MKVIYLLIMLLFGVSHNILSQLDLELIDSLYKNEAYQEVVDYFNHNTKLTQDHPLLAGSYFILGDYTHAKRIYNKIYDKEPKNLNVIKRLASIYESQQDIAKAIKYYTLLNELLPDNPIYYRKNGDVYRRSGNKAKAIELYQKAHSLNIRDVLSIEAMARLYHQESEVIKADSMLSIGLSIDSIHIGLNILNAKVQYQLGHYDRVVEILERVEVDYDFEPYLHKLIGYAYLQIDSVDHAIQRLQTVLVHDKNPEKSFYYLALAYEKLDDHEGAMAYLEKTLEASVSPSYGEYLFQLGRLHKEQNNLKEAIIYFSDAYEYTSNGIYLYELATTCDVYYKDHTIAINYYRKYLDSDDDHTARKQYAGERSDYLSRMNHQKSN